MAIPLPPSLFQPLLTLLAETTDLILLELLLRTGIRTHEIRTVIVYSAQDGHYVLVKACKGSEDHHVPINDDFALRLGMHFKSALERYQGASHESFKRILRMKWDEFKSRHPVFKPYSLHSLRGGFALTVYKHERDPLLVQQLLGHRAITSTMAYLRQARIDQAKTSILRAVG